jgi:hypothetical protein
VKQEIDNRASSPSRLAGWLQGSSRRLTAGRMPAGTRRQYRCDRLCAEHDGRTLPREALACRGPTASDGDCGDHASWPDHGRSRACSQGVRPVLFESVFGVSYFQLVSDASCLLIRAKACGTSLVREPSIRRRRYAVVLTNWQKFRTFRPRASFFHTLRCPGYSGHSEQVPGSL